MAEGDDQDEDDDGAEPSFFAAITGRLRARADVATTWLTDQRPDHPFLDFVFRFFDRDGETAGGMLGGAVAFRFFLFIIPVVLLMVGALGFIAGSVDIEDAAKATGIGGALRSQVASAFDQSHSTRWIALLLGIWGSLWAGRSLAKVLAAVSGFAWQVPVRRTATFKALAGVTGVLIAAFAVAAFVGKLRSDAGIAVATIGFGVVMIVYLVSWYVISLLLPRATRDPAAVLPGAALLALTTSSLQWFSQIWLPDRFSHASQLYGAIGITAVTLGFFFLLGRAFVFAMVLNAVTWERVGTVSTFLFSLPVIRRIPARFPAVDRFFGLSEAGSAHHA